MRRLVIPAEIEIEGERWRILRERDAPKRHRLKSPMLAAGVKGRTLFKPRVIVIADGLADDDVEETLVHELLHALLAQDDMLGAALEEHVVELLDGPLTRLLRRLIYLESADER